MLDRLVSDWKLGWQLWRLTGKMPLGAVVTAELKAELTHLKGKRD